MTAVPETLSRPKGLVYSVKSPQFYSPYRQSPSLSTTVFKTD